MRKHRKLSGRVLSLLLCAALLISCLPLSAFISFAAESETTASAYWGIGNKVADAPTLNDWKQFFGETVLNTGNVGTVWTDKSVFTSVADYLEATDEAEDSRTFGLTMDDNNFLVSLSAIASSKSVEGYEALPSDTMLVLDLSESMSNSEVDAMVQSANNAITTLQTLNPNNRVGVVAFSGYTDFGNSNVDTAEVILPLGRYTAGVDGNNKSAYLMSSWTVRTGSGRNQQTRTYHGVKVASGVTGTVAEGVDQDLFSADNSKVRDGGTYIQNGLYQAWQQFDAVTDTTVSDGLQAGTGRIPVMVLLGDGAATAATTNYTAVGTSDSGNGSTDYATTGTAFLTQLTAAWVRDKLEQKYGRNPLVYTLGLGVGNSAPALNVLDPTGEGNNETDDLWADFIALGTAQDKTMTFSIGNNNSRTITYTEPVLSTGWSEAYVDEYFSASNAQGLIRAFEGIVENIVIQSLYYPTHVASGSSVEYSGYLNFQDYIGVDMEVKAVKGIQLGTTLYNGQTMARLIYEGGLGTVEQPTDIGIEMLRSVQQRLGIPDAATAREVINKAYNANQLYYNPDTGAFSNYIGWYADKDGKYIGFWDGKDDSPAAVPAELADDAVYAIKSYGYYDAVGEGLRKTDMMYATIQVRTTLKVTDTDASQVGESRVIGRLPAALIPLVEYHVDLTGIDPMNPKALTIQGATAPSRLLYEVGLDSDVDLLDLAGTATTPAGENGTYTFYTNQWSSLLDDENKLVAYNYLTNKNTTSYFSPSIDNERYYYHMDSPIYVKSGSGYALYTDEQAPAVGGEYYHRNLLYTRLADGSVQADYQYERVSDYVLSYSADLQKRTNDDGTYWVVLRGTLHHYYGTYIMEKGEDNLTGTAHVSDMPFVHDASAGITPDEYHVDSYLGNNGRLTIDPFEGLAITKIADDTILDREQVYTFTVSAPALAGEGVTLLYEAADGTRAGASTEFNADGALTVQLCHGETAYLLGDNMTGKTFTVTENVPGGAAYEVSGVKVDGASITGTVASVTVAAQTITPIEFTNTFVDTSQPVIVPTSAVITGVKKFTVESGVRTLQQGAYQFELWQDGARLYTVSNGDPAADDDNDPATAAFAFPSLRFEATGTYTYTVRETIPTEAEDNTFAGITYDDSAYTVTVTVTDPDGDGLLKAEVTYPGEELTFENTYTAAPTSVNLSGEKTLNGDTLAAGDFTFDLYAAKWDADNQAVVPFPETPIASVQNGADGRFAFSADTVDALNFNATGAYRFILKERVPADADPLMVYDPAVYTIEVNVTDNLQGQLVTAVTITKLDGSGQVTVLADRDESGSVLDDLDFANTLKEEPVNIELSGTKTYTEPMTEGQFTFLLYQALVDDEGNIYAVGQPILFADNEASGTATEATFRFEELDLGEGETTHYLTFDEAGTYYFVVKEQIPDGVDANNKLDGVTYDPTVYTITVQITLADENGRSVLRKAVFVSGEEDGKLVFENTYTTAPTGVTLSGEKTLNGDTLAAGDFTFDLYVEGQTDPVASTENDADGRFAFSADTVDALNFNAAGTYRFTVKERVPEDADSLMVYDQAVYTVEVKIADNRKGQLIVETVTVTKTDVDTSTTLTDADESGSVLDDLDFVNTLKEEAITVELGGTKTYTESMTEGQFTFLLYEADVDDEGHISAVGEPICTAGNAASGTATEATFRFEELTFEEAGTYYFVVKEQIPDGVDANNKLDGVTYDATVYTVTVEITLDTAEDGRSVLRQAVLIDGQADGKLVFENTYTAPEPEPSEPEPSEPETSEPETSEPETSEPETSEPETSEPEAPTTGVSVTVLPFALLVAAGAVLLVIRKKTASNA